MSVGWPRALWLLRHGESVGNVARERAWKAGEHDIQIDVPDHDVPLSDTGERQAADFGAWLAGVPREEQPTVVLASPYVRTAETARIALHRAGRSDLPIRYDERLRDREQGWLDRLTWVGADNRQPDEADRRRFIGKFFYRPPGGESWADVGQRIRQVLNDLRLDLADERVLVVAHDVSLLMVRYVLEELSIDEVKALAGTMANCAVTAYEVSGDGRRLVPVEAGQAR